MLDLFMRLVKEEEGQGLIEYALIAAIISVIAIATILLVGDEVAALWTNIQTKLVTWKT